MQVVFLGPVGTYSHQAAFDRFGPSARYKAQNSISDIFKSFTDEEAVYFVPKENSIFGPVIETYDNLRSHEIGRTVFIRDEVTLKVQHCFLVPRGLKLKDIKKVMSHEQALGQCTEFLKRTLPGATLVKKLSTASAAEAALSEENRNDSAAICSKVCASIFPDLEVLFEGIQNERDNFTKFWVLSYPSIWEIIRSISSKRSDNALLRFSYAVGECSSTSNLTPLLAVLDLVVKSVDRRPSELSVPFHNVYFIEVTRNYSVDISEETYGNQAWEDEVARAIERTQDIGWDTCLLGTW